ncbi:hypothetical protein C8J57DRAFT_132579 [Mycena rebaudengoi]|nr:hypothetical protein C8J57DRAFT_132579 [Mycena rebaudengoi]
MLSVSVAFLAWSIIPFCAALPSTTPNDAIDFGKFTTVLTSVPKNCDNVCTTFTKQLSINEKCTAELKCLCSIAMGSAISQCFSCLSGVANTTAAAGTAKMVLAEWEGMCRIGGISVAAPGLSTLGAVNPTSSASVSTSTNSPGSSEKDEASDAAKVASTSDSMANSASASPSGKPNGVSALGPDESAVTALMGALLALIYI